MSWLVARPIAHRGLHSPDQHVFENTGSAARAAIAAGCAIECDVQLTRDGEAVVFHDFTLDRLTGTRGAVVDRDVQSLTALAVGGSGDHIMTLSDLLALVGGRTPLICEIKSAFDGDMRLATRVATIATGYAGPLALKSFDPAVLVHLRETAALSSPLPLGMVAEAHYDDPEWAFLSKETRRMLVSFTHVGETRPDFLSFHVNDLPHAATSLFRKALGRPVMAWTVRTAVQRSAAVAWADQIVFEGAP